MGDPEPREQGDDPEADNKAGEVEPAFAAEHARTEAIDHSDHRI